jgi:hypothetical protein
MGVNMIDPRIYTNNVCTLFLLMTITLVLIVFIFNPILLQSAVTLSSKICRSSSVPAIKAVSSAYRMLFIRTPLILIPSALSVRAFSMFFSG